MIVRLLVAQESWAMKLECQAAEANTAENRQRADAWVRERLKAFLPPPGEALRIRSLELTALQTELAQKGIMSTCQQYRDGRIDRELADITLAGFEQTISDFIHDLENEAKVMAGSGQVSQIDAIRRNLTTTAGIARQAALLGLDPLAQEARRVLLQTLMTFSSSFLNTCWNQSFDDEVALQIERQNQLEGTGIDVMPCANRRGKRAAVPLSGLLRHASPIGTTSIVWYGGEQRRSLTRRDLGR